MNLDHRFVRFVKLECDLQHILGHSSCFRGCEHLTFAPNVKGWLGRSYELKIDRISAVFGRRRAMLTAPVTVKPDSAKGWTIVMDSIPSAGSND